MKKVPFGLLLFAFVCTFLFHGMKIQANAAEKEEKILIAYFSRAGENYSVGVVEKRNTRIFAGTIANQLGDAEETCLFIIIYVDEFIFLCDDENMITGKYSSKNNNYDIVASDSEITFCRDQISFYFLSYSIL